MRMDQGFTVVEVLVAVAITLVAAAGVLDVLSHQLSFARAQPAATDVVQVARAAVDVVGADVLMAGAGFGYEPSGEGLTCCLPPVVPRRIGAVAADAPTVARSDVLTLTFVPAGVFGAVLDSALAGATSAFVVKEDAPCVATLPACGMKEDHTLVVFDGVENHAYYRVAGVNGKVVTASLRQANSAVGFGIGSRVVPVETHTYYFDTAQRQLRHYDGYQSDVPVADDVIDVRFEYVGETAPPAAPKPPMGTSNCMYDSSGNRWPTIGSLAGGPGLVELPLTMFADGPWCGTGANQFDIDLLRIRRVRMSIRVQAPDALRASGPLFLTPGRSQSALRLIPDLELVADIAPRNMDARR